MHYQVVYDKPGRLRLRFGKHAFTKEERYGIAQLLQPIFGVKRVITHTANGSVLVEYGKYYKQVPEKVKCALQSIERNNLPVAQDSDEQRQPEADTTFIRELTKKIGAWGLRRLFLPMPLCAAWSIIRSLKFIAKGLSVLANGQMKVEVLDATALAASLLQRNFNSAGMIMLLLDISSLMEDYTHARSRIALEQSLVVASDDVWLCLNDGSELQVQLKNVCPGDEIRIRTGAMIPVDGSIVAGEAAINEATMTRESKLALKHTGASVFAGTIVEDGNIVVRVSKTGAQTRIANIVKMVDESQDAKAGIQTKAERLADGIVLLSFLGFLVS